MREHQVILLIEDDMVDVMTLKRALSELRVTNPLHNVGDGEAAMAYLRDPSQIRPAIILLDLNLPRMSGIEFLQTIKQEEVLKRIPVVVLTTSKEDQDRIQSYDLGVAGYMLKPVNYLQFLEVIRTINLYWTLCELAP